MAEDKISFIHMHTANESIHFLFKDTPYINQAQEYRLQMDYSPFMENMVIEPGLKELLKKLSPDFGRAVATNRSNTIGKVLELNGLEGMFDIVISSLDVKEPKPHPESIFKILDFFNLGSSDAFYVGDSMVDYETARAANVIFISYKNGELNADYRANCMSDIWDIVKYRR
jgi:phosphoglycolate phosphatase-like HAD superfamily hydrolase